MQIKPNKVKQENPAEQKAIVTSPTEPVVFNQTTQVKSTVAS